jgi:glycine cleavage system transcriptional repressor
MSSHFILTALGQDRPGLVEGVSAYIFERGGNIADSRMINLRGQFAIMMLIGGSESSLKKIQTELGQLGKTTGLQANIAPASDSTGSTEAAMPYQLTATAMDQAGLVHRIAQLLREEKINIENMDTELKAAPITGSPMFEMKLVMSVPKSCPVGKLREKLSRLCDELNIDWQLKMM